MNKILVVLLSLFNKKYRIIGKNVCFGRSYKIKGKDNKIILFINGKEYLLSKFNRIKGLNISINGNNNTIRIGIPSNYMHSKFHIYGNDNFCEIGESKYKIKKAKFNLGLSNNRRLIIGKNFSCESADIISLTNFSTITIGDDCMFADEILIRNSDGHVITNKNGDVINIKDNIKIGNHVWLGVKSTLLKSSNIPDNCIVGACSLVTGNFENNNAIIVGVPAKEVKNDIQWFRENSYNYEKMLKNNI